MNLGALNLNLILVFDAIMQERHVTRAAQKLGRTQSAVSHSLKQLREAFDDDLFVRTERDMEPTPRAIELADTISAALADLQGAFDRFGALDPVTSARHFRLGLSDATTFMFLPALIAEIQRISSGVTVSVRNLSPTEGYDELRKGALDCMILGNAPDASSHLHRETILTEKYLCGLSPGSPVLGRQLSLEDYLACPHIQVSLDGMSEGAADEVLRHRGLARTVVATVPNYLAVPWVVRDTNLIVTIGEAPLMAMADLGVLALARPPIEIPDVVFSMIYDRRAGTDPGNRWLRSLFSAIADEIREKKEALYRTERALFA